MKISSILTPLSVLLGLKSSAAFVPVRNGINTGTKVMARKDSSNEIQEALRISREFGLDSKEARVAWDIVEEIDASDNIRCVTFSQEFRLSSLIVKTLQISYHVQFF
jgi:hypothetical protein